MILKNQLGSSISKTYLLILVTVEIVFWPQKMGYDDDQDHQVGWVVEITYPETVREC